jgi:hypothetical protein
MNHHQVAMEVTNLYPADGSQMSVSVVPLDEEEKRDDNVLRDVRLSVRKGSHRFSLHKIKSQEDVDDYGPANTGIFTGRFQDGFCMVVERRDEQTRTHHTLSNGLITTFDTQGCISFSYWYVFMLLFSLAQPSASE